MWAEHAVQAWTALSRDTFQTDRRSVRVLDGPRGHAATAWPLAHVLWAAGEIRSLGADAPIEGLAEGLERLRRGDGYAPTPRARYRYFDDNAWIGLASTRLHEVTE